MFFPRTLAQYPFVVVRLSCVLCPQRRGRYRLAQLVARFGPDADLDHVRRALAAPCHRLAVRRGKALYPACQVDLPDLYASAAKAADLPP